MLGDPGVALAWLVNELSGPGITLKAGEVVTTGTCLVPLPIQPGVDVRADFGALGAGQRPNRLSVCAVFVGSLSLAPELHSPAPGRHQESLGRRLTVSGRSRQLRIPRGYRGRGRARDDVDGFPASAHGSLMSRKAAIPAFVTAANSFSCSRSTTVKLKHALPCIRFFNAGGTTFKEVGLHVERHHVIADVVLPRLDPREIQRTTVRSFIVGEATW